jgi:hypothetical protein
LNPLQLIAERAEDTGRISFAIFPETKFAVIVFAVSFLLCKKNCRLGSLERKQ